MAITFYSCKNNEDDKGKKGKLVKTVGYSEPSNDNNFLFTGYYDAQNRLIKVEECYQSILLNLTYSANTIIVNIKFNESGENHTHLLHLDNNGYLIEDDFFTYFYENGYLKEKKAKEDSNVIVKYSWMNGNMMQMSEDPYYIVTYEYSSKENLSNIDLVSSIIGQVYFYSGALKFKGLASKNHLVKMTETSYDGVPHSFIHSYDYKFDEDGYPTEIIGGGFKFTLTYY